MGFAVLLGRDAEQYVVNCLDKDSWKSLGFPESHLCQGQQASRSRATRRHVCTTVDNKKQCE